MAGKLRSDARQWHLIEPPGRVVQQPRWTRGNPLVHLLVSYTSGPSLLPRSSTNSITVPSGHSVLLHLAFFRLILPPYLQTIMRK